MAAVDEFDLVGDAVEDDGAPSSPTRRRRGRAPTPWVAAAVVLVLGGAVVATPVPIVMGRGDGPELGLLDLPLDEPPTVVWQTDLTYPSLASPDIGGRLIVTADDDGSSRLVVALDPDSGAEIWRYEDTGYSCQFSDSVACVSDPGTDQAAVVTIDADGTPTSAPHPRAVAAIVADAGTVVIEDRITGVMEDVVLVAPDGTERWRVEADAADTLSTPAMTYLRLDADAVVFEYFGTALALSTGNPVDYPDASDEGSWFEQTEDSLVLHTEDGQEITLEPDELPLWIDDDVGGPVIFRQLTSGAITASVREDGTELWRLDDVGCYPWLRLQGSIVIGCWSENGRDTTSAVDELTGEQRWAASADWPMAASLDAVLLTSAGRSAILALDPVTGRELWAQELPDLTYAGYSPTENGLLVTTDDVVARLSW